MPEAHRPHRRAQARIAACIAALVASAPALCQEAGQPEDPNREDRRVVESVAESRWAALAMRNGHVAVYDLAGGRRHEWAAPAEPVRALALDPMGISALPHDPSGAPPAASEAPVVLICTAGPGQEETTLHTVRGDTGMRLAELRIPGAPAALLVAPGEGRAYVITAMVGRRSGDRVEAPGKWTLRSLDLATGKVDAAVTHDGIAYAAALSPAGDRIYVAMDDSIRSFSTRPLRSSWMLRSPGRNLLVEPIGTAGAIAAVRDSQLAIINPDNLPGRDGPTGEAPNDDAIATIDLPFIGRHLDVNGRTGEAIVLDARGTRLATVDLERAEVSDVEQVPEVAAAIYHPDRQSLVLFEAHAERVFEMLHEPPHRGDVATAQASGETGMGAPGTGTTTGAPPSGAASATNAKDEAPSGSGEAARTQATPPPAKEAAVAGVAETAVSGTPGTAPPQDPGTPPSPVPDDSNAPAPPLAPEPPAEPAESAPSGPTVLAGSITGDLSLVESVVLYGPDSVLREQARIAPGADGSFIVPETPPGRYRVVVVGKGGVQLRCTPPMRIIQVGRGAVPPLDFEVSGQVKGRLAP